MNETDDATATRPPPAWLRFTVSTVLLMLLWLALTSTFDPQELVTGAVVAVLGASLAAAAGRGDTPLVDRCLLYPKPLFYLALYVPYLLVAIVRSNIDVALRVLRPTIPINPGVVRVRTKLRSRMGRMILANSITLTPGTLSVDIEGDLVCVHWIDVGTEDIDEATRSIVGGFERYLEVILG